jgi:hypothetical protein
MKMKRERYASEESSKLTTNKGLCILEKTIISHLVALSLARLQAKGIKARQESVAMKRIVIIFVFFSELQ